MKSGSNLIRKSFVNVMIVTVLSLLSQVVCVMIDAIVTGQFLGTTAVTATGLMNPVITFTTILGTLFGPGLSVVCTRYIGMAKQDRVNQAFSSVMLSMLVVCVVVGLLLFTLAPVLANALGGGADEPEVVTMITDYFRGYAFGMIPLCLNVALTSLMTLDNDQKLAMIATGSVLAADICFDLLNVLVFHGGMCGMAIATSLANLLGLLVMLTHFFKKDRLLHFSMKGIRFKDLLADLKDVMLNGIPNAISTLCQSIRTLCFNSLFLVIATAGTVAALSAANSTFTVVNAVAMGMGNTVSMMCSLLYGEEDRNGILEALRVAIRTVLICFVVITILLMIFAGPLSTLFLSSSATAEIAQAKTFIRVMAIETMLMFLSYVMGGAYTGTGRMGYTYVMNALREGVFPILCVLILGNLFGLAGAEIGFIVAGALTLITCFVIPLIKNKKFSFSAKNMLMLPDSFGCAPEELFEASMRTMDEVVDTSVKVLDFCKERGTTERNAVMTSLYVEEMAGNTIKYGYPKKRKGTVDLRVICRDDSIMVRVRHDGKTFDPFEWMQKNESDDPASGTGIRIMLAVAKDVSYIQSMKLNNLMLWI